MKDEKRAASDDGLKPAARTRPLRMGQHAGLTSTLEKNNDQDMNYRQVIVKDVIAINGMGNEWQPEK